MEDKGARSFQSWNQLATLRKNLKIWDWFGNMEATRIPSDSSTYVPRFIQQVWGLQNVRCVLGLEVGDTRRLDSRGAWASRCLDSGQNTQAALHLMKTRPFALFTPALWWEDKGNGRQNRATSPGFGQAKNLEDWYESGAKFFYTPQPSCWDSAAESPGLSKKIYEYINKNPQFQGKTATFKI